jgi:hypothetical protein
MTTHRDFFCTRVFLVKYAHSIKDYARAEQPLTRCHTKPSKNMRNDTQHQAGLKLCRVVKPYRTLRRLQPGA